MVKANAYENWYNNQLNNQIASDPIQFTLDGYDALLADEQISEHHKAAARAYLARLKFKTRESDAFAAFCAVGAALSSIAYFMAMRGHEMEWNAYLILPSIVGCFVAAATWYTYQHDTAELFLTADFSLSKHSVGTKQLCVGILTAFLVAIEVALSGYGVYECLPSGDFQTILMVLVCAATVVPEWAQTQKYLEKWILDTTETYDWNRFRDWRFSAYMGCSVLMLAFCGMAIYPLLESQLTAAGAIFTIMGYTGLGLPYFWKKTEEQLASQDEPVKQPPRKTTLLGCLCPFTTSRVISGFGDLAFSAYGFFETMKLLGMIEKPADVFNALGDTSSEAWKPYLILMTGVVAVVASCVGSFLMTANGDQESYGEKISHVSGRSAASAAPHDKSTVFHLWRGQKDLPAPASLKLKPPG